MFRHCEDHNDFTRFSRSKDQTCFSRYIIHSNVAKIIILIKNANGFYKLNLNGLLLFSTLWGNVQNKSLDEQTHSEDPPRSDFQARLQHFKCSHLDKLITAYEGESSYTDRALITWNNSLPTSWFSKTKYCDFTPYYLRLFIQEGSM